MSTRHALWASIPAVVAVFALSGCEQRVTSDNLALVKTGMTIDQVQDILGKGSELAEPNNSVAAGMVGSIPGAGQRKQQVDRRVFQWKEDRREITVTFENGKVVDKGSFGF